MITILYFASLREQLDCADEEIELPADIHNIAEFKDMAGTA